MNITAPINGKYGTLAPLERYFIGQTRAWGIFEDRFGAVQQRFGVDVEGRMEAQCLILEEFFTYSTGETDSREWRIDCLGDGSYVGRADGVVGTAKGTLQGSVINWTYRFDLPVRGRKLRVRFRDRMYFQDDGVMLNRATISKFGIDLGTVLIAFSKPPKPRDISPQRDFNRRSVFATPA